MKRLYLPLLALGMLLQACTSPTPQPDERLEYVPILMSRAQLETSVIGQLPQPLRVPGKIFISGRYLFINEQFQGIHIYDNANPARPEEVKFLRIPGNIDMAVRGSLLYADNGPDLVVVNISNPAQPQVVGRTREALPELAPPVRNARIAAEFTPAKRPANTVIVGWQKR